VSVNKKFSELMSEQEITQWWAMLYPLLVKKHNELNDSLGGNSTVSIDVQSILHHSDYFDVYLFQQSSAFLSDETLYGRIYPDRLIQGRDDWFENEQGTSS
jgi:hypothetical protein